MCSRQSGSQHFLTLVADHARRGIDIFDGSEEIVQVAERECAFGLVDEDESLAE